MKRISGMIPPEEVEMSRTFKTSKGMEIHIEVSKHGWTTTWGGRYGYITYRDIEGTVESNLQDALDEIKNEGVVLLDDFVVNTPSNN